MHSVFDIVEKAPSFSLLPVPAIRPFCKSSRFSFLAFNSAVGDKLIALAQSIFAAPARIMWCMLHGIPFFCRTHFWHSVRYKTIVANVTLPDHPVPIR
jgi:hypothetical protein